MDTANRRLYLLQDERQRLRDVTDALWQCRTRIEDDNHDHLPMRDDEHNAITPLLESGYELIGTGLGRHVLQLPATGGLDEYVVKLGRYGTDLLSIGMFQNYHEITLWDKHGHEDWPLLPPVDWQTTHTRWLIMPYGTPLNETNLSDDECDMLLEEATEQLQHLNELDDLEFEPVNFVLWDNDVWLADYGRPNTDSL